jgi:hypothetical protein
MMDLKEFGRNWSWPNQDTIWHLPGGTEENDEIPLRG